MLQLAHNPTFHFIKSFLRNPAAVGAIVPSSKKLAQEMVRGLHLSNGDAVLELGPGTGSFTNQIRTIMPDTTTYTGIECEPNFVKLLKRDFPEFNFVQGRAEHAWDLYRQAGIMPPKVIISGIPFANQWGSGQERIIENLQNLMPPGSVFRTFQYVHAYSLPPAVLFRQRMKEIFGPHQRSQVILRNLPPAFVLTWRR